MKFKVSSGLSENDTSEIPTLLNPYDHIDTTNARIREVATGVIPDPYGRLMPVLNGHMWHEPATEIVTKDTVEVWNITNLGPVTHPIHIHLIQFQILSRKDADTGEEIPLNSYEKGWKDTVVFPSGTTTTVAMHFTGFSGEYVWHCHILEHENHDMMRPLRVIE